MPRATVTSKHQITLPRDVRRELNLGAGDRIVFHRSKGGWVLRRESPDAIRSDGAAVRFIRNKVVLSVDEIRHAAVAEAGGHYGRRRS